MRTGLKSSTSVNLRVTVGGSGKGYVDELFIPYLTENGELHLPKWNRRDFLSRPTHRNTKGKLLHALLSENAASHHVIRRVFATRDTNCIRRWLEEWEGIIDSLLLFDLNIFRSENRGLLRALFRKVLHISMFNVDTVTAFWKEFSVYAFAKPSRSVTIGSYDLSSNNPFCRLLQYPPLKEILSNGFSEKIECQSLAHLVSTRQMVPGGAKKLLAALDKFKATTSVPFIISDTNMERAKIGSHYVGRRTSSFARSSNRTALCHISLSSAGDYDFTKISGGRGAAIQDSLLKNLTDYPTNTGMLKLPFGLSVREECGVPRYVTWCRPENLKLKRKIPSTDIRWKARYVWEQAPVYGFGSPREDFDPNSDFGDYALEGYDSYLGAQIFHLALYEAFLEGYIDMDGPIRPFPARTSVVPEPGGKSRIVTVTKWWVIILQQPFGHLTKGILGSHPSASAGLTRSDQAWLYLDLLSKVKALPNGFVLSSDLEEATDAIAPDVAEAMVRAFYKGFGYQQLPKLVEIGIQIGLRSKRLIEIKYPKSSGREPVVFLKQRGVMMGEPVTKSVLTLYSLVCEEMAMRDFHKYCLYRLDDTPRNSVSLIYRDHRTNRTMRIVANNRSSWESFLTLLPNLSLSRIVSISYIKAGWNNSFHVLDHKLWIDTILREREIVPAGLNDGIRQGIYLDPTTYTGPIQDSFRAFAVGGDDHIAYGPKEYLELITSNHFAFGSKISIQKHGYSNVAVKFCEKVLYLRNSDMSISPRDINRSVEQYDMSVWVDSIKVRLLSPLSKSMDVEDDRNIAIGKSGQLSRTLQWLNVQRFSDPWCDMVTWRFAQRMYPYLPKPNGKDQKIWFHLKLPMEFGGLGLKLKSERYQDIILNCPRPTIAYVKMLLRYKQNLIPKPPTDSVVRAFKRMCTANSSRGIKTEQDVLEGILLKLEYMTLSDVRVKLNLSSNVPVRVVLSKASSMGIYSFDRAIEQLSRCRIFLDSLRGKKRQSYKTVSWRSRYYHLWKSVESDLDIQDTDLSQSDLQEINNLMKDPLEFLPVRFYNLFEAVADLAMSNLTGGEENSTIRKAAGGLALLLARGNSRNPFMKAAAIPLLEKITRMLPDLNLRMDFSGNAIEKATPEPVHNMNLCGESESDEINNFLDCFVDLPNVEFLQEA